MKRRHQIIPDAMWVPIFLALSCNTLAYYGSRLLTESRIHHNISSCLDAKIPLVPWTIAIYWGCYIFWIVNYVIACRQEEEKAFQFMSADFLAKIVCFICFIVFPTTITRPVIEGNSLWDILMQFLYHLDAADNLFPSIHCLTSYFCFIAVRDNKKVPRWYQAASFIFFVSICISTLTTRQHVLIDVIGGILLGEICWQFVGKSGFSKWYAKITSRISINLAERKSMGEQKN